MKEEELVWIRESGMNLALKYYFQFEEPPEISQILSAAKVFTAYLISGQTQIKLK